MRPGRVHTRRPRDDMTPRTPVDVFLTPRTPFGLQTRLKAIGAVHYSRATVQSPCSAPTFSSPPHSWLDCRTPLACSVTGASSCGCGEQRAYSLRDCAGQKLRTCGETATDTRSRRYLRWSFTVEHKSIGVRRAYRLVRVQAAPVGARCQLASPRQLVRRHRPGLPLVRSARGARGALRWHPTGTFTPVPMLRRPPWPQGAKARPVWRRAARRTGRRRRGAARRAWARGAGHGGAARRARAGAAGAPVHPGGRANRSRCGASYISCCRWRARARRRRGRPHLAAMPPRGGPLSCSAHPRGTARARAARAPATPESPAEAPVRWRRGGGKRAAAVGEWRWRRLREARREESGGGRRRGRVAARGRGGGAARLERARDERVAADGAQQVVARLDGGDALARLAPVLGAHVGWPAAEGRGPGPAAVPASEAPRRRVGEVLREVRAQAAPPCARRAAVARLGGGDAARARERHGTQLRRAQDAEEELGQLTNEQVGPDAAATWGVWARRQSRAAGAGRCARAASWCQRTLLAKQRARPAGAGW